MYYHFFHTPRDSIEQTLLPPETFSNSIIVESSEAKNHLNEQAFDDLFNPWSQTLICFP